MDGEPSPEELAERAVAWALAHAGSAAYATRCLAFVEDAYERSNGIEVFGGASAAESQALYGTRPLEGEPPPRGALVFYACSGPIRGESRDWGHVGLSLGDGRVVHAWDVVRIDRIADVAALPPGAGWTSPIPVGWTPAERLLAGHRRRTWPDG